VTEIRRYEVPVDDLWYDIALTGWIVHVDSRSANKIEFWAVHDSDAAPSVRSFRAYGDGRLLPGNAKCIGTAVIPPYVWHLMERS
jgi:hypothetical protein